MQTPFKKRFIKDHLDYRRSGIGRCDRYGLVFTAKSASVPVTLFLFFLQPVVIDPLYNDFYPLKNKELEQSILKLADQAD